MKNKSHSPHKSVSTFSGQDHLEVLPEYQLKGIGGELVSKLKEELSHLYMIDLLCDEELIPYYEKRGMNRATGMLVRNYANQNGSS